MLFARHLGHPRRRCINDRLRTVPAWAFPRPDGRGRAVVLRIEPPAGVSPLRASIPNVSAPLALRAPLAETFARESLRRRHACMIYDFL